MAQFDTNKTYFTGTLSDMDAEVAEGNGKRGLWQRINFRVKCTYAPNRFKLHFCTAWGDQAVEIAKLKNGDQIGIFGTPETSVSGKNGKTSYFNKVTVDNHGPADVCPSSLES